MSNELRFRIFLSEIVSDNYTAENNVFEQLSTYLSQLFKPQLQIEEFFERFEFYHRN